VLGAVAEAVVVQAVVEVPEAELHLVVVVHQVEVLPAEVVQAVALQVEVVPEVMCLLSI
jgi:hypothetical protein